MKDRGLMTSKIVSVRGDSDIVLENGDYLAETDLVKVIPQEESSHTPSFRQLNEHVFVVGHSRTPIQVCSQRIMFVVLVLRYINYAYIYYNRTT